MKQQIKNIAPLKSAIAVALVGFFLAYPAIGLMYVFAQFGARPQAAPFPSAVLIAFPVFVAFFLLAFACLGAVIYNLLARFGLCIMVHTEPNPPVERDAK
jgi:hypothetical protein